MILRVLPKKMESLLHMNVISKKEGKVDICLCTAVWNESYIAFFLDVTLPSYLSSRNIPSLLCKGDVSFSIATNSAGIKQISSHKIFSELKKVGPVFFEEFSDTYFTEHISKSDRKYNLMSKMYHPLLIRCLKKKMIAIFATPDMIISNGALINAFQYTQKGKKIVSCPCVIRVNKEEVLEKLYKSKISGENRPISLSHEDIGNLVLKNIHKISKTSFVHSKHKHSWKNCQFISNGNLILGRCAHYHAYIIDCRNIQLTRDVSTITLDGGVKDSFNIKKHQIHIITDSRKFGTVEVSSKDMNSSHPTIPASNQLIEALKLMKWQTKNLDYASCINYFHHLLYLHTSSVPPTILQQTSLRIRFFFYNLPGLVFLVMCRKPLHYARSISLFIHAITKLKHSFIYFKQKTKTIS